ncbi:hypothetical protein FGE12_23385 [Aggregicoccus sp. 17bor-14]|nr:hypothetical protein [Simulacricoccus sp. 17bor-14]MRI91110.1 hypothetical protein [Aggregicoccus sp. 17bor-14]
MPAQALGTSTPPKHAQSSSQGSSKKKRAQKKPAAAAPPEAPAQPETPAAPPPSDAPRAPPEASPAQQAPADPSLDFELLEPEAKAAAPDLELERAVSRRRTMLSLHQGLGLGMAGGLVATTLVGQLNFNDIYRGGGDDGTWKTLHRGLAVGTTALFGTVALMGILAPEPYPKPLRFDTVLMHKVFMSLAAAGMVTQVVLGLITASSAQQGQVSQVRFATAHQVVGYATLGFTTAGVFTLFL